MKKTKSLKDVE